MDNGLMIPAPGGWGYGMNQQVYPQYQGFSHGQQAQPVSQNQQGIHGLIWVDGEIGAKAYQLPGGWPPNYPIALWDTNDTVIYLKSINPMGMPNPLQKAHYTLENARNGQEASGDDKPDMSQYVKREDLERMKQDLMDTIGTMNSSGTGIRRGIKGES